MTYRDQAQRPEDGPEPLQKGPAKECPGCQMKRVLERADGGTADEATSRVYTVLCYHSSSPLSAPRACTPRSRLGWLWWKCTEQGSHLHERCNVCGLQWLTAFVGGG